MTINYLIIKKLNIVSYMNKQLTTRLVYMAHSAVCSMLIEGFFKFIAQLDADLQDAIKTPSILTADVPNDSRHHFLLPSSI